MRRYVPRVLVTAALAVSAAACATAGTAGAGLGEGAAGGRYRVLVPDLEGPSGDRVADELRVLLSGMATHTAVAERAMQSAMREYDLNELNEITARQLAQQVNVENVLFGTVQQGGAGLQADVKFIDVRSGDEITIEEVSGADPVTLAQAIFAGVEQRVEGIRQAAFCNDYLSSQQFERALETCDQALAIVPQSTSALYGRATALLNLDREQESLQTYRDLLEVDPTHQDALLGAGLAASRLDQSSEAQGFYRRYMEINPGNVQVRMTVANDIAQTGDYVSAFRMLEPVIQEERENVDFMRYLFSIATAAGQRVQEQENRDAARPIYEVALQAYQTVFSAPDAELDAAVLRQAIAVNNAMGNSAQALQLARDATQRFPQDASIWSQYASVLVDAGQHGEAAQALTRLLEVDPNYENAHIRRAMALMEAGQRQQALADLEQAAERGDRENVAKVLFSMANGPLNSNQFQEAQTYLELAQRYATGDLRNQVSFFLGYALYKQGETIAKANTQGAAAEARRALPLFQRALELVRGSGHAQAPTVASAAQQYIENQEAIIQAARG